MMEMVHTFVLADGVAQLSWKDWIKKNAETCACGRKFFWGYCDGKRIPLDPVAPVYAKAPGDGGINPMLVLRPAPGQMFVSHLATCPKASQFSGRNRGQGYQPRDDQGALKKAGPPSGKSNVVAPA